MEPFPAETCKYGARYLVTKTTKKRGGGVGSFWHSADQRPDHDWPRSLSQKLNDQTDDIKRSSWLSCLFAQPTSVVAKTTQST